MPGYEADGDSERHCRFAYHSTDYPQLKELAWHVQGVDELSLVEAHSMYERNKRFLDFENLSDQ